MSADKTVEERSRRRRRREVNDDEIDEMGSERGLSERKGRATPGRRTAVSEEKGGNFVTRRGRGVVEYFQGVNDELSKVVWPDRADTIRLTRIVLAVTIAASLALGLVSFLFTELFVIGIRNDQPVIFLILGAVVAAAYFAWNRLSARDSSPY